MAEVAQALRKWNPWWGEGKVPKSLSGIERDAKEEVIKTMTAKHVKDIIGVRRAGKTTLMYQIIDYLIGKKTEPTKILFIKFDDVSIGTADFGDIEKAIYQINPEPEYLFLDEVQEKKGWEKWVKNIYDIGKFKQIFITGSSASLLSRELGTLLTGRHISFRLMPFSFKEYIKALGWTNFSENYLKAERLRLLHYLSSYLKNGGFPETLDKNEAVKKTILSGIFNDIIARDIVSRHAVETSKLNDIVLYLITNSGKEYSYRSVSRAVGINIETAERYMEFAKDAFLIFSLSSFSFKLKAQFKQNKKIYCIDTGMGNAIAFKFSEDSGRVYENSVFLELKRRGKEVYYWKSKEGLEVDFLVKEGLKIKEAVQVCKELTDEKTKKREIKSLLAACKEFKLKSGIVITEDREREEKIENKKIRFVPLWKWLLDLD